MKTRIILGMSLFLLCTTQGTTPKYSRSFLFTRPVQQNLALKQALWHNLLYNKEKKVALEVAGFFLKTTESKRISQYFLPPNRDALLVSSTALNRDVLPKYLSLPDNFSGYLALSPEQTQGGFLVEGRYGLGDLLDFGEFVGVEIFKNWFFYSSIAFVDVKNNLNLTQSLVQNPGPSSSTVYDIITAFNNPTWGYDKINGAQHSKGVSEIRAGLATTVIGTERVHLGSYSLLSIPTQTSLKNEYLFNSEYGYGHVGVVWGVTFQVPFNKNTHSYLLAWTMNFESIFLIRNHQYRTFDLNLKPWSRFILMRKKDQAQDVLIPGVNVLTHRVRVSPHAITDFVTGLRLSKGALEAEVGYGLWAHGGERCKITGDSWIPDYGLAGSLPNTSASTSTVANQGPNDPVFVTIIENDIDLHSGEMSQNFVNKIYGAIGFKNLGEGINTDGGIGGFFELPHNRTNAFRQWGLWVTVGVAF